MATQTRMSVARGTQTMARHDPATARAIDSIDDSVAMFWHEHRAPHAARRNPARCHLRMAASNIRAPSCSALQPP